MKRQPKSTQVIEPKARAIIFGHGRGWVFTPRDLTQLGDPRSVGMALTRLSRKGVIRQLARGLYDFPIDHPALGRVAASADAVAKALVSRDSVRLQPAGAYAANILGLSDQVPMKIVFLTDGASRRVKLGQREIILKHTTPRNVATAGRKSGTVDSSTSPSGSTPCGRQGALHFASSTQCRRQGATAQRPQICSRLGGEHFAAARRQNDLNHG